MDSIKHIVAEDLNGIIEQVSQDFASGISLHDYHVMCQLGKHYIKLDISSSPGGGEEGGYETTSINTALLSETDFRFILYPEDFMITIGKLFGLQDIKLGYPEFDKNVVVKTNDEAKLKSVLEGEGARRQSKRGSVFSSISTSDCKCIFNGAKPFVISSVASFMYSLRLISSWMLWR